MVESQDGGQMWTTIQRMDNLCNEEIIMKNVRIYQHLVVPVMAFVDPVTLELCGRQTPELLQFLYDNEITGLRDQILGGKFFHRYDALWGVPASNTTADPNGGMQHERIHPTCHDEELNRGSDNDSDADFLEVEEINDDEDDDDNDPVTVYPHINVDELMTAEMVVGKGIVQPEAIVQEVKEAPEIPSLPKRTKRKKRTLKEIKKQLKEHENGKTASLSQAEVQEKEISNFQDNKTMNKSINNVTNPQKVSIHGPQPNYGKTTKRAKKKPTKGEKFFKDLLPFDEIKEKINGMDVKQMLIKLKPIPKAKLKRTMTKSNNITADIYRHIDLDETITLLPHSRGVVGVISNNLKNVIGERPVTDLIENGELIKVGNKEIQPSEANTVANEAYLPMFWNQMKSNMKTKLRKMNKK